MEEHEGGDGDEDEAEPEEEAIAHGRHVHPVLRVLQLPLFLRLVLSSASLSALLLL